MPTCLVLLALQGTELARWVDALSDPDVDVRTRSEFRIFGLGLGAAPALRAIREHRDPEVAARASAILDRLAAPSLVLGDGRGGSFPKGRPVPLGISLGNPWGEDVVVHPESLRVTVTVLELREEPPQRTLDEPAIFFPEARESGCALAAADFQVVPTGGRYAARSTSLGEVRDLRFSAPVLETWPRISLDRATLAGLYRIDVRYEFDPAGYQARCSRGCPGHDRPEAPWNRCGTAPLGASALVTLR